jgi:hypothetical protein
MKRLLIAALLLLAGCAGHQTPPPQSISAVKTIGVISLLGDQFTVSYAGWTPFGNSTSVGAIAGWGIDQRVADDVAASLGQRIAVTPMLYDPAPFGRGIVLHDGRAFVSMQDKSEQPLHQILGAQPGPVDAVLLVTPAGAPTGSGMLVRGLGLLRSRPFFLRTDVHALYRITLVRTGDDAVIGDSYAPALPDCRTLAGPCRTVAPDLWNADFATLTPDQVQALQTTVVQLIDASLPAALQRVGLIP